MKARTSVLNSQDYQHYVTKASSLQTIFFLGDFTCNEQDQDLAQSWL